MNNIVSDFKISIDGVYITEGFEIHDYIHEQYIKQLICNKDADESITISGEIESDDKNKNYLIYINLQDFLLRLFSLFGVNVKIERSYIKPESDYIAGEGKIKPPIIRVASKEILGEVQAVRDSFNIDKRNDEFYSLIESNKNIDMIHRFRSLFSAFDKRAPKNASGHIEYHYLEDRYVDIIDIRYNDFTFTRYKQIIDELIKSELKDDRANKDYSQRLEEGFKLLKQGTIINKDVAYNLLKCIQIVRNKLNHGSFENLSIGAISGSYELLLPLTQELMKSS